MEPYRIMDENGNALFANRRCDVAFLVHLPRINKRFELIGKLFLIFVGIEMEPHPSLVAGTMIYKKRPRDCFAEGGLGFVD